MTRARRLLLQLMVEDQVAYETLLTAAKKLALSPEPIPPEANSTWRLLASIRVSQAMGATSLSILELADKLVDNVNHYLLSGSWRSAARLSMATIRCGFVQRERESA